MPVAGLVRLVAAEFACAAVFWTVALLLPAGPALPRIPGRVPRQFSVAFADSPWNLGLWGWTLRRLAPPLRLFLRPLGDARNQPRDTNDRGDDNENDVLIPVHVALKR